MSKNLAQIAKTKKIKYFLISFVDLFGVLRSKLVPARAIGEMQKNGAGFAGFATWLDMTPADADMFAIPDPDSLIQLPWNKEVGWLASDLWMNGKPVEASPRVMLKNQIKELSKKNLEMKSGVECEYFLISPDGKEIADKRDIQSKPCYDQSALMRRYELIKEICDSMIELGWGPYQNDHEDANGQFEMNWDYENCLVTADRHVFFKFMVKSLAEKHELRATFMPKPFENLTGNGCHAHVSLWKDKQNKFLETGDRFGLSKVAYNFLGGIPNLKIIYSEVTRDYSELEKYKGKTWFHYTEEFKDKEKYRYIPKWSAYNHLYITSLDLFLEKPLTGRGIKSFRETCKEKVHLPNRICSTHQHNYHLQILNDTGLIGYLIFFGVIIFIMFKCFRKNNLRSNIYFYAALSVLLIEFMPLRSTGGFFSTINSAYIFLMIGILLGLKELGYKSKDY